MKRFNLAMSVLLFGAFIASCGVPVWGASNENTMWPPMPKNLPAWLRNTRTNHIFPKRGVYNDAIYRALPILARDLNGVAVGHAMAYEDLVTGRAKRLESQTFNQIRAILSQPPRFMPDEGAIAPTFARQFGVLEQVFDWAHIAHAQSIDVLTSPRLNSAQKDAEIEALWKFYETKFPGAITPLPMNMKWLDGQPYSGAFRRQYPKINGLFWGYHWLQTSMFDATWNLNARQQNASYEVLGARYRSVELFQTKRAFMPMFAETSPMFAARFPQIANMSDNLHMLHDMVNDILATDALSQTQKRDQITRAIWVVSAQAHRNCKAGENRGVLDGILHDHRFMDGMPGMGLMPGGTTEVMPMSGMGWMRMNDCHHCSMPLPNGENSWKAASVSAAGWTMRVRCALCARDMSLETKGRAILRLPLERRGQTLLIVSQDDGTLTTEQLGVVFLEEVGSHAGCNVWSQAFSNAAAFHHFIAQNPRYKRAKMLSFADWANRESSGTPDTYEAPVAPGASTSNVGEVEK